jgi:hypothetical protein
MSICSLPSDSQSANQRTVAFYILIPYVIQQPAPVTDQFHQTMAGVVITLVHLEMLCQMRNAIGE